MGWMTLLTGLYRNTPCLSLNSRGSFSWPSHSLPMVQMVLGEVKKLSDFNPASLHQSLKIHPTSGLEGEGLQGFMSKMGLILGRPRLLWSFSSSETKLKVYELYHFVAILHVVGFSFKLFSIMKS